MARYQQGQNRLTNNYTANMFILFSGLVVFLTLGFFDVLNFSFSLESGSAFINFAVFILSYFFTSYWFSPDLDIHSNRPGKGSFPFKALIKVLNKLRKDIPLLTPIIILIDLVISPLHHILNFIWRWLWEPFGHAFTHRGVVHWPIVGSNIKILYLLICYWLFFLVVPRDIFPFALPHSPDEGLVNFIRSFYAAVFDSEVLLSAFFGIMIADICHIAIDYLDTVRNGSKNFVPPEFIAPRGFILQFFKFFYSRIFSNR